jgi:hypothetical protein
MQNFFYTISAYSALLPLLAGLFFSRKLDTNSKLLLLLVSLAAFSQLNAYYTSDRQEKWEIFNIYCILDAFLWSIIFVKNCRRRFVKGIIALLFFVQLGTYIGFVIQNGLNARFFYDLVCLSSVVQLVFVLTYFYERYRSSQIRTLEREPMFWFCLGLLLYNPNTYFLFVYYELVREQQSVYSGLWILHDILNTCMYILFTLGIFLNSKSFSKA